MADRRSILIWSILLPAICAAALAVRLYHVLARPETQRYGFGPFGDTFMYHEIAVSLWDGKGFAVRDERERTRTGAETYRPSFARGPGYPLFICAVYGLTGYGRDAESPGTIHRALDRVRIAQCILDALCVILVFSIARIFRPESLWAQVCAAALYALSWYTIYYTRALLAETLATFLLALFILSAVRGIRDARPRLLWCADLALGCANLCRTGYFLFLPLFALFLLLRVQRRAAALAVAFIAGAFCAIAPWTIRNCLVFGKPILIAAGMPGLNLYLGALDTGDNWRGWGALPKTAFIDDEERDAAPALYAAYYRVFTEGDLDDYARMNREFTRLALRRIKAKPGGTVRNWIVKAPRLWFQNYVPLYRDREASGGYALFYFIFAVVAWCACPRARLLMAPVVLLFAYLTLLFLPLFVEPRFGVPLMPGIIAMAGVGICDAAGWLARLRARMAKSSTGGGEP